MILFLRALLTVAAYALCIGLLGILAWALEELLGEPEPETAAQQDVRVNTWTEREVRA